MQIPCSIGERTGTRPLHKTIWVTMAKTKIRVLCWAMSDARSRMYSLNSERFVRANSYKYQWSYIVTRALRNVGMKKKPHKLGPASSRPCDQSPPIDAGRKRHSFRSHRNRTSKKPTCFISFHSYQIFRILRHWLQLPSSFPYSFSLPKTHINISTLRRYKSIKAHYIFFHRYIYLYILYIIQYICFELRSNVRSCTASKLAYYTHFLSYLHYEQMCSFLNVTNNQISFPNKLKNALKIYHNLSPSDSDYLKEVKNALVVRFYI